MKKTTHKSIDDKFIAVEDLIGRLGLLEADVFSWLGRDKPRTRKDHMGRISIPLEFLEIYSNTDEYKGAFKRAVAAESSLRAADNFQRAESFKSERVELQSKYDVCINDLEILHRKYLDSANKTGQESSAMAAYLLFSRVITTLKMFNLCLKNGYWSSGSLLREIDECLDVAEFFVITKDTPRGKKALNQWFRQNRVPRHEDCRKEKAIRMASLDKEINEGNHRELLNELYQKKSKFTHPTFATIREVTKYNVESIPFIEEINYGSCNYERKLYELTHFFRSSIWSSFQIFLACFIDEFPLLEGDINYLLGYDKKFTEWNSVTW